MVDPDRIESVQRPDGCSIAYRIYNPDARKTLVLSNGLGCGDVLWRHLIDDLATDHRLITWDYRGQGDSSAASGPGAYSASAHAADLTAIQDAAGVAVAGHIGYGLGALVALEHHSWATERVEALVLLQGGFSLAAGRLGLFPWVIRRLLGEAAPLATVGCRVITGRRAPTLLRAAHGFALRTSLVGRSCNLADFEEVVASMSKQSLGHQLALARGMGHHQPFEALAKIKVPTLVFGSDRDPLCPETLMRQIHESLHNSEYVQLPGASHASLVDHGPVLAARIRRFLEERRNQPPWKER